MKMTKKTCSLIILLLLAATFNSNSMELEQQKSGWVALAGAAIIGGYAAYKQFLSYIHSEPTEPFPFTELPKDVQNEIIALLLAGATATSLKEAAQTINSLAQVNHELNELINDPDFCLKLIKHLAQQFNCSDEEAAAALQTQEAKRRLWVQKRLQKFCNEMLYKIYKDNTNFLNWYKYFDSWDEYGLNNQIKNYITDFEFTYSDPKEGIVTPLMICSSNAYQNNANSDAVYVGIIQLIATGVDVNRANSKGTTALMLAAKNCSTSAILALLGISNDKKMNAFIQTLPTVNVNQQDLQGNTALMHIIFTTSPYWQNPWLNTQDLLDAGADPELANYEGLTPLAAAKQTRNQRMIDLIQHAINKKHGGQ